LRLEHGFDESRTTSCGCLQYIGSHCIFGPGAKLVAMNHNYEALHVNIVDQGHTMGPVTIKDNVWIAAGAIILPNVKIKRGAVVAAGAVVTKSVDEHTVVAGIPAVTVRKRGKISRSSQTKVI
jgi:acetyltransferase-like isoleucine patch superfamily enzyme